MNPEHKKIMLKHLLTRGWLVFRTEPNITDKWRIQFNPKPVPGNDWDWWHVDYDGTPDSGDTRCGTADTAGGAIQAIEDLITSPPEKQPNGATLFTSVRDAVGLALYIGIPVTLVVLAADLLGLFE